MVCRRIIVAWGALALCLGCVPDAELPEWPDGGMAGDLDEGTEAGGSLDGAPGDAGPGPDGDAGADVDLPEDGGADEGDTDAPCTPEPEQCNNLDDDCDGIIDNDVELGGACETGTPGRCADGVEECFAGGQITCRPLFDAIDEECNGIDDDCDGTVDESEGMRVLSRPCFDGEPELAGVAPCQPGEQVCVDGQWGPCEGQVLPSPDECDGIDNDCNGDTDTGCECIPDVDSEPCYEGAAGTAGVGPCRAGLSTCTAEAIYGDCEEQVTPVPEACDGADNDCDGHIDEGFINLGSNCSVGLGPCRRDGRFVCSNNAQAVVCDATAANPGVEVCDGVDNDCDGRIDNSNGNNDGCNGLDDDGDCRIDEADGDCGPRLSCSRTYTLRSGLTFDDRIARAAPGIATRHPVSNMIIVTQYDPANDEDFGYNLALNGRDLLPLVERGNGDSFIQAKVCSVTMGGLGGIGVDAHQVRRGNDASGTNIPDPVPGVEGAEVSFALVEAYQTFGDNDMGYNVDLGQGFMSIDLNAPSNNDAVVLARGYRLETSTANVRLTQCTVNVEGNATGSCTVDSPGPSWEPSFGEPIIAVMDHVTGPDGNSAINDMAHAATYGIENNANRLRCTISVSNPGNDTAAGQRVAARCTMIWRQTHVR